MPTILVADDNSNIQKMVGIALKDHGVDVIAVGNGEAAVRKLAESLPDLILADIFMPVRNGYEVCEYVKKDDRFAHIPVILLVGAFDPLDEHEVERVHANGVLKKPFVPPDPLIELVKSFISKPAGASPTDTQPLEEDVQQTQDIGTGVPPHIPTGTIKIPMPDFAAMEKTQRMEPERTGTVALPRPDRTQPINPPAAPVSADNFKLDLSEPKAAPNPEKTAQLSASEISKILQRESPLSSRGTDDDEYRVPPPVVDFQGEASPVAFEDLLEPAEEEAETPREGSNLGLAAFEAAEVHEEAQPAAEAEQHEEEDAAAVHFGGIREEAKTPDPELPPIPVHFDQSEPLEIITEEHAEAPSGHVVAPSEDLVASHSDWASSTATGPAHEPEPELVSEGSEGFMTPMAPPPMAAPPEPAPVMAAAAPVSTPPTTAAPMMGGIAREEMESAHAAAAPKPALTPEEFEETAHLLPKNILQEEVNRAQEIAARVAAQNREFIANQEAASAPAAMPAIDHTISAVDSILARHRAQAAPVDVEPEAAAAAAPPAAPAPEPQPTPELVAPTVRVPRLTPTTGANLVEMISDRVLAQLDPYIIEKISKEIVRPIVEAMVKRELDKQE